MQINSKAPQIPSTRCRFVGVQRRVTGRSTNSVQAGFEVLLAFCRLNPTVFMGTTVLKAKYMIKKAHKKIALFLCGCVSH